MPLSCRFYSQKFPEVEDVVMVNVRSIGEMGAYVHLLEYKNIEGETNHIDYICKSDLYFLFQGMILLSELSRRRIRSINKLIRVGRSECVVVIRVDKEKGYIDLSKRRVSPEDIVRCEEKFAKAKAVSYSILSIVSCKLMGKMFAEQVQSILRHVAEILCYNDAQLEELYTKTAWHFDEKVKKQASSYDLFKLAVKYAMHNNFFTFEIKIYYIYLCLQ